MGIWKIALRSIQQRGLSSSLTALSMALGVMLVVIVLVILGVVGESFSGHGDLGYNMVIGKKGSKLQLVLNTVFYLSQPIENIPHAYYEKFATAEQLRQDLSTQPPEVLANFKNGEFSKGIDFIIPVALGDYYDRFRVVGTTPRMFDNFYYNRVLNRKYEFAAGRNFEHFNKEHGYFEAVIGSTVARETKLKVGDSFAPAHGSTDGKKHDHNRFHIVGVLKPSGTPIDRAVFVNIEGFYLIPGHIPEPDKKRGEIHDEAQDDSKPGDTKPVDPKPAEQEPSEKKPAAPGSAASSTGTSAVGPNATDGDHDHVDDVPLPLSQREVTAILVRTASTPPRSYLAKDLPQTINKGNVAQVVSPLYEIESLFSYFLRPIESFMIGLAMLICLLAGVSILVSIYNSMSDRKHEIAVMRALGAGRSTVLTIVLAEAVLLSLAGGLVGWFGGHVVVWLLGSYITEVTGVQVGLLSFGPVAYPLRLLASEPPWDPGISSELLLVPGLIILSVIVGLIPAITAYRTDVGKALSNTP